MPPSFPVSAVLRLRDLFTGRLRSVFARAERQAEKSGRRMGNSLKGIGKTIASGAKVMAGGASAVLGVGLIGGLANAGARVRAFEATLEDLRVQANMTRPQADELRSAIRNLSDETKVSRATILAGAEALANQQGGAKVTTDRLEVLARATKAASAPAEQLVGTWDALDKAFFGGAGSAQDMEAALSAAIEAGKQGSVPLSQMGTLLARVATQFDDVTFRGKRGIADLTAALQVVKGRGFGEASEAATGMNAAIRALVARSKQLSTAKFGRIKVFDKGADGVKRMRDLRDILEQMSRTELVKDQALLREALGDAEAIRFIGALLDREVRQQWDSIADAAWQSNAVQSDFAEKQTGNLANIDAALLKVSNSMDDAFSPERLADAANGLALIARAAAPAVKAVAAIVDGYANLGRLGSAIHRKYKREQEKERIGRSEAQIEEIQRLQEQAGDAFHLENASDLIGQLDPRAVRDAREQLAAMGRGSLSEQQRAVLALADREFVVGSARFKAAEEDSSAFRREPGSEHERIAAQLDEDIARAYFREQFQAILSAPEQMRKEQEHARQQAEAFKALAKSTQDMLRSSLRMESAATKMAESRAERRLADTVRRAPPGGTRT